MEKGENANFEQFHLFPQCFPKNIEEAFENILWKGNSADIAFFSFPTLFSTLKKANFKFWVTIFVLSANTSICTSLVTSISNF